MSDPPIWERLSGGVWSPSNSPSYNTTDNVYIQSGNIITTGGNIGNDVNIKILWGGVWEVQHPGTVNSVYVYDGGVLQINNELTVSATGNITVEDGGEVHLNHHFSNPSATIWNGAEIFHPNSNLVIQDWHNSPTSFLMPVAGDVSVNNYNGYSACFGNLIVDMSLSANTSALQIFPSGYQENLTHGNLILKNSASDNNYSFCMMNAGNYNTQIGGNVIVENGFSRPICFLDNLGQGTVHVKGDLIIDTDGILKLCTSNQVGTDMNLTVDGDIIIQSGTFDLNNASSGSGVVLNTVNLKGDLIIAGTGKLMNSYPFSNAQFNFSGIGDGLTPFTTQTIDVATTDADENSRISFAVKEGAYVQLINRDFELGTNSGITVEDGGIFDFGFDGLNGLLCKTSGSQTGTYFYSQQGSVLKITSADGINLAGNLGNVQTENRQFDQTAYFHYIGKENQSTGDALLPTPTGKFVVVQLDDNNTTLTLNNNIGISNDSVLDIAGGKLAIRKGIVLGTNSGDFIGSGRLEMTDGEYRISTVTANPMVEHLPQLEGYSNYALTNGTVHLNANNATQILSSIPDYYKLTFSGNNNANLDFKGISGTTTVNNGVYITDMAIVNIEANSLNGSGGLVMDGGRLRISKQNIALPELEGIATPYALTGGVIELYGSSSTQQQILKGGIHYHTLELNATDANFLEGNLITSGNFSVAEHFEIYAPAVCKLQTADIITGDGDFTVHTGGGLLYGNNAGISVAGAVGNVQVNGARTFSSNASYGFIGSGNMVSGTGLPSQVNHLIVMKDGTSDQITLTNPVTVTNTLQMVAGDIVTSGYTLELGTSTAQKGTLDYNGGHVVGTMKRWFDGFNTGEASGLFPIGVSGNDRFVLVEYTGSAPTVGGSLTASFQPLPMGSVGLPINNMNAVGSCASFDVTSTANEGYWQMEDGDGLTGGNYDITLVGENLTLINSLCELTALKRVGAGPWEQSGNHTEPTGNIARPVAKRTSASGWSNWGLGMGIVNPLPVELVSFNGNCDGNDVRLTWSTASEINSSRFVVERSADLQTFDYITEVMAAGNSNNMKTYEVMVPRVKETAYYRLRQDDYNGDMEYFEPISVTCEQVQSWHVYANGNMLYIQANEIPAANYVMGVWDMNGKNIYSENITAQSKTINRITDLSTLDAGMYLVSIRSQVESKTYKIIIAN